MHQKFEAFEGSVSVHVFVFVRMLEDTFVIYSLSQDPKHYIGVVWGGSMYTYMEAENPFVRKPSRLPLRDVDHVSSTSSCDVQRSSEVFMKTPVHLSAHPLNHPSPSRRRQRTGQPRLSLRAFMRFRRRS